MAVVRIPPFNQYLGIHVDRMEAGEALARIELGPQHTNNRGVAHGGVVSSLLDSAMGAAVISAIPKEWWCATTGLSIQFEQRGLYEDKDRALVNFPSLS